MDLFQYDFMVRALIVGALISVVAPVIGSFLVVRRYSLMADTLAHVSLVGVAVGLLLNTYPFIASVVVTSIAALVVERLRETKKVFGESLLALFLSGSLAVAVLLTSLSHLKNVNLMAYLFGSITTVTPGDVWIVAVLSVVILALCLLLYKEFFITSFDQEYALVSGVPVKWVNTVFIILVAIAITLAIRIVGVLLIGALMIIPVITVMHHTRSFISTIFHAMFVSFSMVMTGIFLSYYANLPSGATIVMLLILMFVISFAVRGKK